MRSKKFNTVILIVLSFYIVYVLSVVFGLRDIIRFNYFCCTYYYCGTLQKLLACTYGRGSLPWKIIRMLE